MGHHARPRFERRLRSPSHWGWLFLMAAFGGACAGSTADRRADESAAKRADRGYTVRAASGEEEGDGGGVAMRSQSGSIDQEDAEDAITRRFPALTRCYENSGPARDFASGAVKLGFTVGLDGKPVSVHVIESNLGSYEVERCLTSTAATIQFPRPHGHGWAVVDYSIEFRSTGEISVADLPEGTITPSVPALARAVASACHDLGVDEVHTTLYVDRHGSVRSAGFSSARPLPDATGACVAEALRQTTVAADVRGNGLGRLAFSLSNADVLHPPALARAPKHPARVAQGRRPSRTTVGR